MRKLLVKKDTLMSVVFKMRSDAKIVQKLAFDLRGLLEYRLGDTFQD